jgi:hypothetical protein
MVKLAGWLRCLAGSRTLVTGTAACLVAVSLVALLAAIIGLGSARSRMPGALCWAIWVVRAEFWVYDVFGICIFDYRCHAFELFYSCLDLGASSIVTSRAKRRDAS